nr:ATP-binding protein [Mucilaginibacter sp. FT3.2]
MDRIVHSAHRVELKGDSMRKKRQPDDKDVTYQ